MSTLSFKPEPIHHPWPQAPAPGEIVEVAEGVFWLRMPLPIALDHINLFLIADDDEWVLVDTGFGTDETCDLWRAVLDGPAAGKKPGRLVCTHHHPDHFGQAGWLTRSYDIPCLMAEKEWLVGTLLARMSNESFAAGQDAFYVENGVPGDVRGRLHAIGNEYRNRIVDPPARFTRLRDGDVLTIGGREWRILALEGHSEELSGLYCPSLRVLIPGDQVLPRISPNISVHWFKDGTEPLTDYLESLDRLADALPADTLVLPAHKLPFFGVQTRIAELQAHHADRLQGLRDAMAEGGAQDAWQLMPAIFPRAIEDEHVMFALGESVAHLAHLVARNQARRIVRDGRVLYEPVSDEREG